MHLKKGGFKKIVSLQWKLTTNKKLKKKIKNGVVPHKRQLKK